MDGPLGVLFDENSRQGYYLFLSLYDRKLGIQSEFSAIRENSDGKTSSIFSN